MILSKNYDEVFFVRDEEMFALILDYESAMFTLDTIKENTTFLTFDISSIVT